MANETNQNPFLFSGEEDENLPGPSFPQTNFLPQVTNSPESPRFPRPVIFSYYAPAEIGTQYFPKAKQYLNEKRNVVVYDESVSEYCSYIIPLKEAIPYQYKGTVTMYISTDGAKLLQAYKKASPAPDQLLLFIEENIGDDSKQVMRLKVGSQMEDLVLAQQVITDRSVAISEENLKKLLGKTDNVDEASKFVRFLVQLARKLEVVINFIPEAINKVLDFIASGLESYFRIPESFWNPEAEGYISYSEEVLSAIIQLMDKGIKLVKEIMTYDMVPDSIKKNVHQYGTILENFYHFFVETTKNVILAHIQFYIAFLSGLWNSIVDLVSGLLRLIQLIIDIQIGVKKEALDIADDYNFYISLFEEYEDNFTQALQKINWGEVFSTLWKNILSLPENLLQKARSVHVAEFGYYCGYIVAEIVQMLVPLLELAKFAKAGKVSELFTKVIDEAVTKGQNLYKATIALAKKSGDALINFFDTLLALLRKGTKSINEFIDEIFAKLKGVSKETAELIKNKFGKTMIEFLGKEGVAVAKKEGQDVFEVFYKEKVIFSGDEKVTKEFLEELYSKNDKNLKKKLEESYNKLYRYLTGSGGGFKSLKVISRDMLAQEEPMSCTAAAIRQIAKDFNITKTEEEIRKLVGTTNEGTPIGANIFSGMKKIFKDNTIEANMYYTKGISDADMALSLSGSGKPWIAITRADGYPFHTIIVDKIEGKLVHIRDPFPLEGVGKGYSGVKGTIDLDEFARQWAQGGNFGYSVK